VTRQLDEICREEITLIGKLSMPDCSEMRPTPVSRMNVSVAVQVIPPALRANAIVLL